MGDISDIQQRINILKFQLSVMGLGSTSSDGDRLKQQIADLQKQLIFEKLRQGSPT